MSQAIVTLSNNIASQVVEQAPVNIAVVGDTASARRQEFFKRAEVSLEARAMMVTIKGKDGAANREALAIGGQNGVQFRAFQGNWRPLCDVFVASTARPIDGIKSRADIENIMLPKINTLIETEQLKKSKGLKKDGTAGSELAKLLGAKAVVIEALRFIDNMQATISAMKEKGEDYKAYVGAKRVEMLGR